MVDEPVSELTEVGAELVEPAFDRLLTSEVLKEVPVLGSAVKVARAVGAIRDRIFAAKIARFLTELGKVDEPEATEMLWQLRKDPEFRDRVGSTLLVVLDRIDELDKAAMVAKAFRAYLHKRIELATFRRMCLVITSAFLDDLGEFVGLESTRGCSPCSSTVAITHGAVREL